MVKLLRQAAYALIVGLVGAALLHLVIVLALPHFSRRDAHSRVLAEGETHRFHRIGAVYGPSGLTREDPFVELSVCAFDLGEAPVQISAGAVGVAFWSLGVFDRLSNEVFSINDRTAPQGIADIIIGLPEQIAVLRNAMPEGVMTRDGTQSILVEAPLAEGHAVLRALAPRASLDATAATFVEQASCAPIEWRVMTRF